MGGNALSVYTRRYEKQEYHDLCKELLPKIEDMFNTKVCLVESFSKKSTFGDMDVLVHGIRNGNEIKDILNKLDPIPAQISKNGNVVSFEHKELQIDLIFTDPENWESSKLFFKYGDMGNLLGKMYHKINIKYGWDGIKTVVRDLKDTKKLGEIRISTDGEKIFEFMGLSWKRYLEGFETEQDVFDYIIQSRFFDPEAFKLKNLNAVNKKRNKRRKGYMEFVKFVEDMEIKSNYTFNETDKIKHLIEIEDYFGYNINDKIKEMRDEDKIKQEVSSKFNGGLVIDWTSIKPGPLVGKYVEGFKNYIKENRNYDVYILKSKQESIKIEFLNYYYK